MSHPKPEVSRTTLVKVPTPAMPISTSSPGASVKLSSGTSPEYAAARQQNAAVQWTQPDLSLLGRVLTKLRQLD